ncbi:MAG: Spo0E like sporulation regulatory protein [Eubacterium sp.]|nr:Spo0E like sporulation regulatory protein [Eubacterium sp.]
MNKKHIEQLREKLNTLIVESSDYSEILKISQELDNYIAEFTRKHIINRSTVFSDKKI